MISTVYEHVAWMEEHHAGKTAFQYYDDEAGQVRAVTFTEYVRDIRKCATYLNGKFTHAEGKHVGILARNSYHYMVCVMGIMLAGAVVVPLNYEENPDNIYYEIEFADVDLLLHDGGYLEREPALKEKYSAILHGIDEYARMDIAPDEGITGSRKKSHGSEEEDPAMILFTSATTGRSKAVMLSEKNLYASMGYFTDAALQMQTDGTETYLLILPMYHVSGETIFMTWTVLGVTVNICREIRYLYRDLKLMHSDMISVVPMVLQSFYKDIKRGRIDRLGGLKSIFCGAAAADPEIFQTFRDHGIRVTQGYGMTEIFGSGTNNSSGNPEKDGSAGKAVAGCQLKIDQGEICLKSDSLMMGYYKAPEATAEVIRDGWLYTGDLGYLDEDGYLYITGRKKNLIILSGGENVSPEELENLLLENSAVREIIVRERGQKICAEIFCAEKDRDSIRAYIAEFNRKQPYYKRITEVEFRKEAFPRTASGKMKRV